MRKFLTIFFLLAAAVCIANEAFRMELSRAIIYAGEPAELVLSSETEQPPEFTATPKIKGLIWLGSGTSLQQRIINGKRSVSSERKYSFIVEQPGEYTIPEATVNVNGKSIKTKPLKFNVRKATLRTQAGKEELDINKVVFSRILFPESSKVYYVGEYIPVEIQVFCLAGTKISLNYPVITSGKDDIIYRDYQNVNPENPRYDRPRRGAREVDGKEYICYLFRTEIKMISAGKVELKAQTPVVISVPDNRGRRASRDPFFDDFFDMGFSSYRTIRHSAQAVTPAIEIKTLPPVPAGSLWLGLVGNWNLTPALSARKTNVGTALTFTLKISGDGGLENLKAPQLNLKDFRVYAPEITKGQNGKQAEIRYTIIPTKPGKLKLSEKFCTFERKSERYKITDFTDTIECEAAKGFIPAAKTANVVDSAIPERTIPEADQEHSLAGIMYLKKISEGDSMQNNYFSVCLLGVLLFGILFVIICEIAAFFLRGTTTAAKRRTEAGKQKKILLKKLGSSEPEQVYNMAPELSEYINNALDLSPGTSLDESAEWIGQNNPELSAELKNISAGAWAPGATVFSEERKQKLIKMLGKLVCLFLCSTALFLSAVGFTQNDAVKAYDNGQFQTARKWYTQQLKKSGTTPALLYNIGNCYYQEKLFAKAFFCYEKAHLLAPRDTEILRNLELAGRELRITVSGKPENPSEIPAYLRDQMTPHEWMILAAIGFSLLLIAFGLRKFVSFRLTGPIAVIGLILLISGTVMPISQYYSTYAPDRAIILEDEIQLKTLPSESAPALNKETLKQAENVEIRERRNEWLRIKAGNAVGWIPAKAAGLLNAGNFSVF